MLTLNFPVIACVVLTCLVVPRARSCGTPTTKYANDVRHGPCVTGDGTPHDKEKYWTLVFSRAQHGEPCNPSEALYGDDWPATSKAYPYLQTQLKRVVRELKSNMEYEKTKVINQNMSLPYTRVCIPNAQGLKAGLLKYNYNLHINPTGTKTDKTATLFYKAFIRNGRMWMGLGVGKALH